MKQILLLFVGLLCFSWQCHCAEQAEFFKTKVIQDSYHSEKIEELETLNYKSCLFHCVKRSECQRVLFCKNIQSFSCTLYDEGEHCLAKSGNETNCKCYKKVYSCNETDCSCPKGFYGDRCQSVVKDCMEAKVKGFDTTKSRLVFIQPKPTSQPFEVQCHTGATRIAARKIYSGGLEVNFNRTLKEYEEGFGNRQTDYWLGLEKMREIIRIGEYDRMKIMFYIDSYTSENERKATYKHVYIGNKTTGYAFSSSEYKASSSAPDILLNSVGALGRPFSTFDNDSTGYECPARFGGGWWFAADPNCSLANINGPRSALSYGSYGNGSIIEIQIQIFNL